MMAMRSLSAEVVPIAQHEPQSANVCVWRGNRCRYYSGERGGGGAANNVRLTLRDMLVAIWSKVVDAIFICPCKVRGKVLHTYISVGKRSCNTLSIREGSWQHT